MPARARAGRCSGTQLHEPEVLLADTPPLEAFQPQIGLSPQITRALAYLPHCSSGKQSSLSPEPSRDPHYRSGSALEFPRSPGLFPGPGQGSLEGLLGPFSLKPVHLGPSLPTIPQQPLSMP